MKVSNLIEILQKLPQDFEIYFVTYKNFGKPDAFQEIIEVIAEMGTKTTTLIGE